MPQRNRKREGSAGISPGEEVDVAALFAQLSAEVRRLGPRGRSGDGASAERLNARSLAERTWPVSADRPAGGRGGVVGALLRPVKLVLRRLMRWYVEPPFADQRAYNDALLKLVDDLSERVDRLEAQLRAPDAAPPAP